MENQILIDPENKKNKYIIIKYLLYLLAISLLSIFCAVIFIILNTSFFYNINRFIEGLFPLSIIGFSVAIFPQILLYMLLFFLSKKIIINKIIEFIATIIIGIIMAMIFFTLFFSVSQGGKIITFFTITETIKIGYSVYISIIISGIIFRITINKINKICGKKTNGT